LSAREIEAIEEMKQKINQQGDILKEISRYFDLTVSEYLKSLEGENKK
jgi:hypothetical protein